MSFGSNFKQEILNYDFTTNAEKSAFLSGVMRICGSIHKDNKGVNLEINSDSYSLITRVAKEIKDIYDISLEIDIKNGNFVNEKTFILKLPCNITKQIASDTGMIEYIGDVAVAFSQGIDNEYATDKEIRAFLTGVVCSSVSITVPQLSEENVETYTGGYHLEMVFSNETLAYDVMNYFAQYDIFLKKIERGDMYGLYIKDSNMISDFMAFFGGNNAVIVLNNIIVARSVRNEVNRVNNCFIANMDKAIEAGQKQYLAIKTIDDRIGLASLPAKLRELAVLRLENPDFTLDQLANEIGGNISKSGINHRFRKIMEIAGKLEER